VKVSVLILTLNEEINIAACLGTLSWSDDIVGSGAAAATPRGLVGSQDWVMFGLNARSTRSTTRAARQSNCEGISITTRLISVLRNGSPSTIGTRPAKRKSLAYMLPGRPLLMFVALYIVKGGFMEGRAGLTFSLLRVWYEFVIDIKVHELQRRERGLPV
jgi:hypothetical protein